MGGSWLRARIDTRVLAGRVFTDLNIVRRQHGVQPLADSGTLDAVATGRSCDMIVRRYFSHQIPVGPGNPGGMIFDLLERQRVGYAMAGENIAMNNYAQFGLTARLVADKTNADLYVSSDHRVNMLDRAYDHVGVGACATADGTVIVTEVFLGR